MMQLSWNLIQKSLPCVSKWTVKLNDWHAHFCLGNSSTTKCKRQKVYLIRSKLNSIVNHFILKFIYAIRSLIYDPTSSPDGFRMFRRKSFEFRGFPSSRISTRLLRIFFLLKIHFKRITKKNGDLFFSAKLRIKFVFRVLPPLTNSCRYLSSFHLSSSIHSQMRFSRRRKILFSVIEDLRRVQDEIIG